MSIAVQEIKARQDHRDARHAALFALFNPFCAAFLARIAAFCEEAEAAGLRGVRFDAQDRTGGPIATYSCTLNAYPCVIVVPHRADYFWLPTHPPLGTKILVYADDDATTPFIDLWFYESPDGGYRANVQRVYRDHERRPNGEIPRPREIFAVGAVEPAHGTAAADACLQLLYAWESHWMETVPLAVYRAGDTAHPLHTRRFRSPSTDD